jgi:hypothetical protein
VEVLVLDTAGEPVQIGRDWILTQKYFLSHGTIDEIPDRVYMDIVRLRPLRGSDGELMYEYQGVVWYEINMLETDWLFNYDDYAPGRAPYWERLNETISGAQILHDFMILRWDKGWDKDDDLVYRYDVWSQRAVRYFVKEPEQYRHGQPVWADTADHYIYSSHWSSPFDGISSVDDPYAVFVIDGEIYVRTKNLFGTGRLLFPIIMEDGGYGDTAYILNMADYNIRRKNYPDFDWDNSCMGKIGDTKILFETSENLYAALELGIMRYSATGRYIPIINKVDWADDRDGTNPALIPPLKQLTGPEMEEMNIYLSGAVTPGLNNAVGVSREKNIIKIFSLDADGNEVAPVNRRSCIKGANSFVMPGNSPIMASFGPYLASKDKTKLFVTDIEHTLKRGIYDMSGIGVAVSQKKANTGDTSKDTMEVTEYATLMGVANNSNDTILMEDVASASTIVDGHVEREKSDPSSASKFPGLEIRPVSIRLVRATGGYVDSSGTLHEGEDVFPDALPAAEFPILINQNEYLNEDTYWLETIGEYESDFGDIFPLYRFRFAWINPSTGEIIPTTMEAHDPKNIGNLAVEYTPTTGVIRFGEKVYDTTIWANVFYPFSIPTALEGWVGSGHFYSWGPTASACKCPGELLIYNPLSRFGFTGYAYTPACEFHEQLPVYSCHHIYSDTLSGHIGNVPSIVTDPGQQITDLTFRITAYDLHIPFHVYFNETAMVRQIKQRLITDGVYFAASSKSKFNPARTHRSGGMYWGVDAETKTYNLSSVCMAHYVYHPSIFKTLPHGFSDPDYTQEVKAWRYGKQLNVMKCRKGKNDQYSVPSGGYVPNHNWPDHAFIAFEVNVDPDEFNKLLAPLWVKV